MANKYVRKPCGLVKDVVVKVDELVFPADFVVIYIDKDHLVLIILGRPFLATAGAIIDVSKGELTMKVDGKKVKFKVLKKESMEETLVAYDPP